MSNRLNLVNSALAMLINDRLPKSMSLSLWNILWIFEILLTNSDAIAKVPKDHSNVEPPCYECVLYEEDDAASRSVLPNVS